jgi:hypothetical protein
VGVDGPPFGRSEPNAARLPAGGGVPAIIGPWAACDVAGAGGATWLTGVAVAAGGGAEADAGVTEVAAWGGVGVCGTAGGSGLAAPEARPLVKPCGRSLAAVVGVGRPAGEVGAEGMLGVLGMDGVALGIDGLKALPPAMGEGVLIGGMIAAPDWGCCTAGAPRLPVLANPADWSPRKRCRSVADTPSAGWPSTSPPSAVVSPRCRC